jgi:hypothetical protein
MAEWIPPPALREEKEPIVRYAKLPHTGDWNVVECQDDMDKFPYTPGPFVRDVVAANVLESVVTSETARVLPHITNHYWEQPEIVQRRERVVTSVFLGPAQLKYLNRVEPHVQLIPDVCQTSHEHPILHLERERAEREAYRYIRMNLKRDKLPMQYGAVVDIGGNASRHWREKRHIVHSTCPILSTADVIRNFNHRHSPNRCTHTFQECTCVLAPAAYLSVDSIYYLTPDMIVAACERAQLGILVTTHHEFNDAYGSFADGEATYHLTDSATVSMAVRGNSYSYCHSNLYWMKQGWYSCGTSQQPKFLCWSKLHSFPNHVITVFRVHSGMLTFDQPISSPLLPSLQDVNYYGKVTISNPLNDKANVSVVGEMLTMPNVNVYSWGPFLVVYEHANTSSMLCPKGLISEGAISVCGKPRTAETFRTLIAYLRYKSARYNIPAHLLDTSIYAAAVFAFVKNVEFEAGLSHAVIKPLLNVCQVQRDSLEFKFQRVWNWKKVAAVGLAATALAVGGVVAASVFVPIVAPIVAAVAVVGMTSTAIASLVVAKLSNKPHDPFVPYRANRSSNAPVTKFSPINSTKLPQTEARLDDHSIATMPVDISGTLLINPHPPTKIENVIDVAGLVTTSAIHVCPANTSASSQVAIVGRVLKPQPFHDITKFDPIVFSEFENYVYKYIDELLPGFGVAPVVPTPLDEWRARFPSAISKVHEQAAKEMLIFDINERHFSKRGGFLKAELLSKSSIIGDCEFTPRLIQSGSRHHNVVTGPFSHAFSKRLAEVWSCDNDYGPVYTSGFTADQIGTCVKRYIDKHPTATICEGDFDKWDSTLHERILKLEIWAFSYSGANKKVRAAMKSAVSTYGSDKFKNKFSVDGTRHSGDQYTSCGNSFLQGSTITYACAKIDSLRCDPCGNAPLLSPQQIWSKYNLLFPVLGDDNFIMGDSSFLDNAPLKSVMLSLGLELSPKIFTYSQYGKFAVHHASFCSSRFYPLADTFVLGPCIGRVLSKAGYYVNIPVKISPISIVRGDAIGRMPDCHFIPFLNKYWSTIIKLTKGEKAVLTDDMRKQLLHKPRPSALFDADASTYEMIEQVYGLTRQHELDYVHLLSSVASLPYRGDFEPLHRAMVIDGICDDVLDIVSDLPLPDVSPSVVPPSSSVVFEDPNCDPTEEKINQIILRQNSSSTTIADITPVIPAKYVKRIYSNVATCLVCEKPFIMCHCANTVHGETRTSFLDYFL